jgi:beta-barrel assembly-enhancing protease
MLRNPEKMEKKRMTRILPDIGSLQIKNLNRPITIFMALCLGCMPIIQVQAHLPLNNAPQPLVSAMQGDSVEAAMSWAEEVKMGEKIFYEFRQHGMWLDDPEIDQYLQRLADKVRPRHGVWATRAITVKAVNDSSINAFALPGGLIGVHTGLIRRVDSESELAGVLAHELSHVSQRHVVRMMESEPNQLLWMLGGILIAAASAKQGNSQAAQGAIMGGAAASMQNQLRFTQSFEREADAVGLQRMEESPFDPAAMMTMLQSLQRQIHGTLPPPYLRTHPLESERMALIEDRIKDRPYRQYLSSPDFFMVRALASSYSDGASEAVDRLKKMLEMHQYSDEQAARYAWAAALFRAERYKEAEPILEAEYSGHTPHHPMLTALYALTLAKLQKFDQAISIYKSALSTWPESEEFAVDYAETLRLAKQPQAAITFLEATGRRLPQFYQGWKIAAECAAMLGKRSEQNRYEALYLGFYMGQWHVAIDKAQKALETTSDWQEKARLQNLLRTLKQREKDGSK